MRERKEAIPHFVEHFLERFAVLHGKPQVTLSKPVLRLICDYHWPGNVRQLKNFLERLFLTASGKTIHLEELPLDFMKGEISQAEEVTAPPLPGEPDNLQASGIEPLRVARQRVERNLIVQALEATGGDRRHAAELLEIKPRTLRQKMRDFDINYPRRRGRAGGGKAA